MFRVKLKGSCQQAKVTSILPTFFQYFLITKHEEKYQAVTYFSLEGWIKYMASIEGKGCLLL